MLLPNWSFVTGCVVINFEINLMFLYFHSQIHIKYLYKEQHSFIFFIFLYNVFFGTTIPFDSTLFYNVISKAQLVRGYSSPHFEGIYFLAYIAPHSPHENPTVNPPSSSDKPTSIKKSHWRYLFPATNYNYLNSKFC